MKIILFSIFFICYCFSFSYIFDINVGAALWEKDKKKELKRLEEVEKINNDIGINFNFNNGISLFSRYFIFFGVGFSDRPTFFFFEKNGKTLVQDSEFNLYYFKFLYSLNSYSSYRNIKVGFSYGITEQVTIEKIITNKVIEGAPTITKKKIWTLTPEVDFIRRLNHRVNLYLRLKAAFLLEETTIIYPQANVGLQIEIDWSK